MGLKEKDENWGGEEQNTWEKKEKERNESKDMAIVGSVRENE